MGTVQAAATAIGFTSNAADTTAKKAATGATFEWVIEAATTAASVAAYSTKPTRTAKSAAADDPGGAAATLTKFQTRSVYTSST